MTICQSLIAHEIHSRHSAGHCAARFIDRSILGDLRTRQSSGCGIKPIASVEKRTRYSIARTEANPVAGSRAESPRRLTRCFATELFEY